MPNYSPITLEYAGNITLSGGTIDGGLSGGAKGTLRTRANVIISGPVALQSRPNLEFADNGSNAHALSANVSATGGWGKITLASQNELTISGAGGVDATTIDVNTGALLWGTDNVVSGTTEIRLDNGGTLKLQGYDDAVGPLTLNSTTGYIDLAGGNSTLAFAGTGGQIWAWGGTLVIRNWDGLPDGNGNDKVIFGDVAETSDGLTSEQLAQIRFENPTGYASGMYSAEFVPNQAGYSHFGQIRPVAGSGGNSLKRQPRGSRPALLGHTAGVNTMALAAAAAIVADGGGFLVSFTGEPGRAYRVQHTTSLGQPWQDFNPAVVIIAPADGVFSHRDASPAAGERFYRAVLDGAAVSQ